MATDIYGYLIVNSDASIDSLPYETEDYTLLPGSIAYVIGGGAYILTPSNKWSFLNSDIQKTILPVFDGKASSGGGGGGEGGNDPLIIGWTYVAPNGLALDKTVKEIDDALLAGRLPVLDAAPIEDCPIEPSMYGHIIIQSVEHYDDDTGESTVTVYHVITYEWTFAATSMDDYPITLFA